SPGGRLIPWITMRSSAVPAGRQSQFGDGTRRTPEIQPLSMIIAVLHWPWPPQAADVAHYITRSATPTGDAAPSGPSRRHVRPPHHSPLRRSGSRPRSRTADRATDSIPRHRAQAAARRPRARVQRPRTGTLRGDRIAVEDARRARAARSRRAAAGVLARA